MTRAGARGPRRAPYRAVGVFEVVVRFAVFFGTGAFLEVDGFFAGAFVAEGFFAPAFTVAFPPFFAAGLAAAFGGGGGGGGSGDSSPGSSSLALWSAAGAPATAR